ncbi:MAG: SLBB domain-containing protein [Bacteroidales bacterium]|nr:SLBB domain-containing protein [Candidatus Cacconaster merdequi]
MKKILSLFVVSCLLSVPAVISSAQTMTEDQIIEYVQKGLAEGKDQTTIGKELLSRGVSPDQVMMLRQKYGNMKRQSSPDTDAGGIDRSRTDNSEEINLKFFEDTIIVESRIFGHDIFRSKNLSFAPNMNLATPVTYVLGPGDEVIIDIYGSTQASTKMKVSPDGAIVVDNVGPVQVAGLTVAQATAKIRKTVGSRYQGSNIQVTTGQIRTILVNVLGEVNVPGTYSLSAFSSVFNALYMAGGISEIGTVRNIKVSRNGNVISTVDVYDYILNGNLSGNVMLQDNDVIIVGPYENLVNASGCVKRPMYYEMKQSESLQKLLDFAGGFTGDAYRECVRVERKDSKGLGVHTVEKNGFAGFILNDGDSVAVDAVIPRYHDMVTVSGAVFHPGNYSLNAGCNSVKTLIATAGGLTEDAVRHRATLLRLKENRTRNAMPVDVTAVLDGTVPDIALVNEDELVIGTDSLRLYDKRVEIYGEVHMPGLYEYSDNQTLQNLIVAAGGLKDEASLCNVEVARSVVYLTESEKREGDVAMSSKIYKITLKDGLPVDGETEFVLKPNDVVTIHLAPDYDTYKKVYVEGEVQYAGMYILGSKNERLSSLVERAGGLSTTAAAKDAVLIRVLSKEERLRKDQALQIEMSSEDTTGVRSLDLEEHYNVGIDLQKAIANPGGQYDVVLRSGDVLRIPQANNTVTINGEVLCPNVVNYVPGKGLDYYIGQGGGYTSNAHRRKTYIIYANAQVSRASDGKVEPGCEIVVPAKPEKKIDVSRVSMWATLSTALATVGTVIVNLLK